MTEQTPDNPPTDPEAASFARAMSQFLEVRADRDELRDHLESAMRRAAVLDEQLKDAKGQVASLTSSRDWYMRRCTELESFFTNIGSLVLDATTKRTNGDYFPLSHENSQPVPKFLLTERKQ